MQHAIPRDDFPLHMPHRAAEWQRMITDRQLQAIPYGELVHWGFGDAVLNMDRDMVSDMGTA
ncbi:hypothetical protein [Paraburkholderia sp. MM5477-R1]|uniref:hypothetical protein n=1 Tax=Paraburkholderia sp. MM5477-R1 TaxID=2991062 RepID=UPI003D24922B